MCFGGGIGAIFSSLVLLFFDKLEIILLQRCWQQIAIIIMKIEIKSLAEINVRALNLLFRELGLVDTLRFINHFTIGFGDYIKEREELFKDLTLDQIITDINQMRK